MSAYETEKITRSYYVRSDGVRSIRETSTAYLLKSLRVSINFLGL